MPDLTNMEWFTVIGLISFGIILILIEVILVPGTTFIGISGFLSGGLGVYLGYSYFGNTLGTIILSVATVVSFGLIGYAFKTKAWERFSLNSSMEGHVNDEYHINLEVGEVGETISALRPIGKALFRDQEIEVKSKGEHISENQKVKIIRIESSKIIVEPIK